MNIRITIDIDYDDCCEIDKGKLLEVINDYFGDNGEFNPPSTESVGWRTFNYSIKE